MKRRWIARQLAKKDRSLVGFWPLQGDDMQDYSGNGAHGTCPNGIITPFSEGGRQGAKFGPGNATNQLISCTSPATAFEYINPFSMSIWFYYTHLGQSDKVYLIHRMGTNLQTGYGLYINNYWGTSFLDSLGIEFATSGVRVNFEAPLYYMNTSPMGKWFNLAAVYSGTNQLKLFINGRVVGYTNNFVASGTILNTPSAINFGGTSTQNLGNAAAYGSLALARIWKRGLTDSEIYQNYISEKDLYRPRKVGKLGVSWNSQMTLFMSGSPSVGNNQAPLYIHGMASGNTFTTLFIQGVILQNASSPLFIRGVGTGIGGMNLFLKCESIKPAPVSIPITITGNTSGTHGLVSRAPLFINGVIPSSIQQMNLFLQGARQAVFTGGMNLLIAGIPYRFDKSTTLFMSNTQTGATQSAPLTITGQPWWSGGSPTPPPTGAPINASMNLFIKRWPSNAAPIFLCCASPANFSTSLFTRGATIETNSVPLSIPHSLGRSSGIPPLFISGY